MEEFSSSSGITSVSASFCDSKNPYLAAKTALSECAAAWIHYLNALNTLCTAGCKLAHSITVLGQCGINENVLYKNHTTYYLTQSWNDLARAATVATSTVKTHILAVLQEFLALSVDPPPVKNDLENKRFQEHIELIVLDNAQTVINIQHQFCTASYDAFSSLTCCLVCQSPVGFPHEKDCNIVKQKYQNEQRSQSASPNFSGCSKKMDSIIGNLLTDQRNQPNGTSDPAFNEHGTSPQHNFHDNIPMRAIFENIQGPLPNPGQLLSMKLPFYSSIRSPLSVLLFPLNGQRRWSEAAAGEVIEGLSSFQENHMRRWSMPWEASKSDQQNTVTWNQTRIMPMNTIKLSYYTFSNRYSSHNLDGSGSLSGTSQDGLTEAIQLLSFKTSRISPKNSLSSFAMTTTEARILE